MNSRRTMILVAAIAIGAIAAFALQNYIKGVEERATPNPVEALVITQQIPRGMDGSQAKTVIKKKTIPAEYLPDTAVRDLKEIEGRVSIANLPANQILVKDMFVQAEVLNTTFRDRLQGDNVAIAISVDGVRAVGGKLQPGDEVNVYVRPPANANANPNQPAAAPQNAQVSLTFDPYTSPARLFYQKVRILAIGDRVARLTGEPLNNSTAKAGANNQAADTGDSGIIILELPPDAAQRFASVDSSSLYFALVPKDWKPRVVDGLKPADLTGPLPGEDAGKLTPYGPNGYAAAVQTKAPAASTPSTSAAPTTTAKG